MPLSISGSVGQRPQPGQVVPGQRIAEDLRSTAGPRPAGSPPGVCCSAGAEDRVAGVVGQAVPAQLRKVRRRQVARPPAGDPGVERDDDALVAGRLGALHQAGGQVAVGRRVELEEAGGVAEFGGDLLHRVRRQRRGDHRHAGAGGRPRRGQVAVAVLRADPDHADRRHEHRRRQASSRTARPTGRAPWRRRTSAASAPSGRTPSTLARWVRSSPAPPAT